MHATKTCQCFGQTANSKRASRAMPIQTPMRNIDCTFRDIQLSTSRMKLIVRVRFSTDTKVDTKVDFRSQPNTLSE